MKVEGILEAEGRAVETTGPKTPVGLAIRRLTTLGIGALVVSADSERVDGVISERDIVRALNEHGGGWGAGGRGHVSAGACLLARRQPSAGDGRDDPDPERHLSAVADGKLRDLVVKYRLDEMELETNVLRDLYLGRG